MPEVGYQAPSAASKYRLDPFAAATSNDSQLPQVAGPGVADNTLIRPWHPDSPLFVFGLLAAATFGLMAVSTSARVGPVRAAVTVGKK